MATRIKFTSLWPRIKFQRASTAEKQRTIFKCQKPSRFAYNEFWHGRSTNRSLICSHHIEAQVNYIIFHQSSSGWFELYPLIPRRWAPHWRVKSSGVGRVKSINVALRRKRANFKHHVHSFWLLFLTEERVQLSVADPGEGPGPTPPPPPYFWTKATKTPLRTVPTIVIAHTFCASRDTRVSYRCCLLIQWYFCAV